MPSSGPLFFRVNQLVNMVFNAVLCIRNSISHLAHVLALTVIINMVINMVLGFYSSYRIHSVDKFGCHFTLKDSLHFGDHGSQWNWTIYTTKHMIAYTLYLIQERNEQKVCHEIGHVSTGATQNSNFQSYWCHELLKYEESYPQSQMSKNGWFDKLESGLFLALTFLNKRYEIRLTPPPFVKNFHKIPVFFEGWLP